MKPKIFIPYLVIINISLVFLLLDMRYPLVEGNTAWDIISEILICIQPLIWIFCRRIGFRENSVGNLYTVGAIMFYTGAFQNVMDEVYEMEGVISQIDKVLMPLGLLVISAAIVLAFVYERRVNSYIVEKSIRDPLTGLYNRHYLEDKLNSILNEAEEIRCETTVAFVDIDNFKRINDTEGHRKGDELLSYIGELIKSSIRRTDYAFRYGGDEFLIVFQNTTEEVALEIMERIKENLKKNVLVHSYKLSMSSGIASHQKAENYRELIHRADQAMYHSKITGKDRVTVASMF